MVTKLSNQFNLFKQRASLAYECDRFSYKLMHDGAKYRQLCSLRTEFMGHCKCEMLKLDNTPVMLKRISNILRDLYILRRETVGVKLPNIAPQTMHFLTQHRKELRIMVIYFFGIERQWARVKLRFQLPSIINGVTTIELLFELF